MTPYHRHVFVCTNHHDPNRPRGCCAAKNGANIRSWHSSCFPLLPVLDWPPPPLQPSSGSSAAALLVLVAATTRTAGVATDVERIASDGHRRPIIQRLGHPLLSASKHVSPPLPWRL